jgi:hypothetical protein
MHLLETVWKVSAGVMVAYALHYGEQEILYGSVRGRMALHRSASAQSHRTRTPQASWLTGDPRRRFLRLEERLPLAVATPRDFPPWKTVYDWFRRWRIDGTWDRLNAANCASGYGGALAGTRTPAPQ